MRIVHGYEFLLSCESTLQCLGTEPTKHFINPSSRSHCPRNCFPGDGYQRHRTPMVCRAYKNLSWIRVTSILLLHFIYYNNRHIAPGGGLNLSKLKIIFNETQYFIVIELLGAMHSSPSHHHKNTEWLFFICLSRFW